MPGDPQVAAFIAEADRVEHDGHTIDAEQLRDPVRRGDLQGVETFVRRYNSQFYVPGQPTVLQAVSKAASLPRRTAGEPLIPHFPPAPPSPSGANENAARPSPAPTKSGRPSELQHLLAFVFTVGIGIYASGHRGVAGVRVPCRAADDVNDDFAAFSADASVQAVQVGRDGREGQRAEAGGRLVR